MEQITSFLRHRANHQPSPHTTERGELMKYFCDRINPGRVGVRVNGRMLRPITMARMGRLLQQIPTKDLYYLKRICDV